MVTRSRFLLPRILPHGSLLRDATINRRCKYRWRVSGTLSALTPANLSRRAREGAECCIVRLTRGCLAPIR